MQRYACLVRSLCGHSVSTLHVYSTARLGWFSLWYTQSPLSQLESRVTLWLTLNSSRLLHHWNRAKEFRKTSTSGQNIYTTRSCKLYLQAEATVACRKQYSGVFYQIFSNITMLQKCASHLGSLVQPVSGRCAVARCISRRRGNTGRRRQVVPWWSSTTSQRLRLDDLSETELTAVLSESTRYVDTCWQPRHVSPTFLPTQHTALVMSLRYVTDTQSINRHEICKYIHTCNISTDKQSSQYGQNCYNTNDMFVRRIFAVLLLLRSICCV